MCKQLSDKFTFTVGMPHWPNDKNRSNNNK